MIIAQKGFQDYEYQIPRDFFEKNGYKVFVASETSGDAMGKFGLTIKVDLALTDVVVDDYEAIVFVGGPGAVVYQHQKDVKDLLKKIQEKDKIIGAICIAPTILALAGTLVGKKATVWNEDQQQFKILEANGCEYVPQDVVVDGKIVTANGPSSAEKFAQRLLTLLKT